MQYQSTLRFDSESLPGVVFEIHKPSYGRKIEFDVLNAAFRDKVRDISKRHNELRKLYQETLAAHNYEMERQLADAKRALDSATEEERPALEAKVAAIEATPEPEQDETIDEMEALGIESLRLTTIDYNPARVRWGLASIANLEIDGAAATTDSQLARGPLELTTEILAAIDAVSGLTNEQLKNLPSPTTFSALVTATSPNTTAPAARVPEYTGEETAVV